MNKEDAIKLNKKFFPQLHKAYGFNGNAVGYINTEKQSETFRATLIYPDNEPEVLDVGCGLGHYFFFLKKYRGLQPKYFGIDVVREFIVHNKRLGINCEEKNFWNLEKNYDYIICLGTLGFNSDGKEAMKFLYEKCNKALMITFLKQKAPSDKDLVLYNPNEMVNFAYSFCDDVKIIHFETDYLLILRKIPS